MSTEKTMWLTCSVQRGWEDMKETIIYVKSSQNEAVIMKSLSIVKGNIKDSSIA
jgi:hypothetical protein